MKKIFLILFVCLFTASCSYAVYERMDSSAYSPQFNLRMRYCIRMIEDQVTENGKTVRRIEGIHEHLCRYVQEDYDTSGKMVRKITCKYNQPHRLQFVHAIEKDYAATGAAKDLFESYIGNPEICKVEEFKED